MEKCADSDDKPRPRIAPGKRVKLNKLIRGHRRLLKAIGGL